MFRSGSYRLLTALLALVVLWGAAALGHVAEHALAGPGSHHHDHGHDHDHGDASSGGHFCVFCGAPAVADVGNVPLAAVSPPPQIGVIEPVVDSPSGASRVDCRRTRGPPTSL